MKKLSEDERWMQRCLELASKGKNGVQLNPMVGSVIVHNNKIIGEGFHFEYGKAHAEVRAIDNVKDKSLLSESTIYVSLEPCAHFGKTPPCSDLIVKHQFKRVVIATIDPFSKVSGKGIEKLQKAGIETTVGVLQNEARFLNRKFFVFHQYKRPFVILKWAESQDGFIDINREDSEKGSFPISQPESKYYNHKWRTEEDSILIGYNTAITDNPQLTNRKMFGQNPVRLVLDLKGQLPKHLSLFTDEDETLTITNNAIFSKNKLINKSFSHSFSIEELLHHLYELNIQSVIIEGGAKTHHTFMENGLWDEMRIIKSDCLVHSGKKAIETHAFPTKYTFNYLKDNIQHIVNPTLKL
ncbi:MAG: bifunctional diaminohydroxyphosphoribosylaminopyrimidine deaminase/5-amino-6-(5-phosphoribosylamino)uracil reductase RibD [Flavobacteriales bacterium]